MMSSSPDRPAPQASSFEPQIHATNLRLGSILAASAIIITLGIVVLFPYFQRQALQSTEIAPATAIGRKIPQFITPGKAFQVPEGTIVEVFDRVENIKVSLILSSPAQTEVKSGSIVEALVDFKAKKPLSEILPPFHLKVLSNQFDLKKVFDVLPDSVTIGSETVPTESFASKHDEFFQVGKFRQDNQQISFLAMTLKHRIPSATLSRILTELFIKAEKL